MKLANCRNVKDLRLLAKKKLPDVLFDFLEGGSDDEITLKRNTSAFDNYELIPEQLGVKNVSLATVYRTLNVLVENNFARKMDLGDGRYVFESKVDSPHHDHMICVSCGDIIEFISEDIELIQERIAKKHKFIMQRHLHQLFGICKKCQ